MSEKRQREARDRREAALERERAARRRAAGADERGNDSAAESQRTAADAHRQAATAAEALRRADVAIEGERIGEPARGVSRADSESSPPGGSVNSPPQRAELDSAITDAVSHAAAVAQAAHDAAQMAIEILASVAALLDERSRAHDVGSAQRADTGPVDKSVDALPADVVIVNPPRAGVDERVANTLQAATAPRAIVYVSCNPATLARDVLRMRRYRVASLTSFDMFPQTAHVETVCELVPEVV